MFHDCPWRRSAIGCLRRHSLRAASVSAAAVPPMSARTLLHPSAHAKIKAAARPINSFGARNTAEGREAQNHRCGVGALGHQRPEGARQQPEAAHQAALRLRRIPAAHLSTRRATRPCRSASSSCCRPAAWRPRSTRSVCLLGGPFRPFRADTSTHIQVQHIHRASAIHALALRSSVGEE